MCRPDRYLELARAGGLPAASVAEVRLRAEFVRELDDLQGRSLRGQALDAEQQNLVAAYDGLQDWRRSHGMAVTQLPDPRTT